MKINLEFRVEVDNFNLVDTIYGVLKDPRIKVRHQKITVDDEHEKVKRQFKKTYFKGNYTNGSRVVDIMWSHIKKVDYVTTASIRDVLKSENRELGNEAARLHDLCKLGLMRQMKSDDPMTRVYRVGIGGRGTKVWEITELGRKTNVVPPLTWENKNKRSTS